MNNDLKTMCEDLQAKGCIYWWEPHVRGDKKKGIVAKEYKTGKVNV
jgi:hypothetical protein